MNLMGESHSHFVEDVEDGIPPVGEILIAGIDRLL